jgi:hypothetical protein
VEEEDSAVIGPVDNRVQEVDTQRFPWNTICHLCRTFPSVPCSGCSGTLIAPNIVLTAGHCLWSQKFSGPPRSIRVAPGRIDRDTAPYGTIKAAHYWVPRGFIDGPDRSIWDFGVIYLARPFQQINRFIPVSALDDPDLHYVAAHRRLSVAGYPGDRPIGTMWRHSDRDVSHRVVVLFRLHLPRPFGQCSDNRSRPRPGIIAVHTTGVLDTEAELRRSRIVLARWASKQRRRRPRLSTPFRPASAPHGAAAVFS